MNTATQVQPNSLLEARRLVKHFPVENSDDVVQAVDDVSFDIRAGETLGLVGESGCGKTTVGRTLLRLEQETAGSIVYDGLDVTRANAGEIKRYRRSIQVIFQDPYSSLNPRMTVGQIIAEPTLVHGLVPNRAAARKRV